MPDRCPADRPINVSNLRSIDISGCIEIFFDPLLSFKDNLIGDERIDNDTRYNAYQAGNS
jgi:hypothetical protein